MCELINDCNPREKWCAAEYLFSLFLVILLAFINAYTTIVHMDENVYPERQKILRSSLFSQLFGVSSSNHHFCLSPPLIWPSQLAHTPSNTPTRLSLPPFSLMYNKKTTSNVRIMEKTTHRCSLSPTPHPFPRQQILRVVLLFVFVFMCGVCVENAQGAAQPTPLPFYTFAEKWFLSLAEHYPV